jgi:hypothetical protein
MTPLSRPPGPAARRLGISLALAALVLAGCPPLNGPAARALELRGSSYFTRPPWKADLRTYYSNVGEGGVEHYLTIDLSPQAGASLARLSLRQIRGADGGFLARMDRARAFVGRPRREGTPVPVQVRFDADGGLLLLDFPQPVPPGTTVTVALRAWRNPWVSDTYLFQVLAWPAGPDPVASPVGVGTLRIYDPVPWP